MAKTITRRLLVEISSRDGWLVAEVRLNDTVYELCRMIRPSQDASLRVELLDAFNDLAAKIIESIMRDDQPDAEYAVRRFNMPEAGHG